jgi:hypothetical protein
MVSAARSARSFGAVRATSATVRAVPRALAAEHLGLEHRAAEEEPRALLHPLGDGRVRVQAAVDVHERRPLVDEEGDPLGGARGLRPHDAQAEEPVGRLGAGEELDEPGRRAHGDVPGHEPVVDHRHPVADPCFFACCSLRPTAATSGARNMIVEMAS